MNHPILEIFDLRLDSGTKIQTFHPNGTRYGQAPENGYTSEKTWPEIYQKASENGYTYVIQKTSIVVVFKWGVYSTSTR